MKRLRLFRGYCFMFFIIGTILLYPALSKGKDPQAGDVTIATSASTFQQKGGDPATLSSGIPYTNQTVFDSLTWRSMQWGHKPALAKSWEIGPNWSHIDFFLREGVKFHNGAEVKAVDVKYSIETYMRKDFKFLFRAQYRRLLKEIVVIGPYHVRIHFNRPFQALLERLYWASGVFPKEYREKVGDNGFANKPVGAGPFRWLDYKQDVYFKLAGVANHYRKSPEIKTLKFIYVPEHSTRLAMLKAGEADIATLVGPHIPQVVSDPNLRIIWNKHISGSVLVYADLVDPKASSPFHDIRVRKATSLAIDRKGICERILFGKSEPWGEIMAPVTLGFDPKVKPDPYDPEAARSLLAQAGYPNGFNTVIGTTKENKYWIEAITANLKDVGIETKVNLYERGAWYQLFFPRKLRGLITSVSWYGAESWAPANLSNFYRKGMPFAYHTTDEIHKAVGDGLAVQSDEDLTYWGRQLSKMIRDSRINLHLWSNYAAYGVNPKIAHWGQQVGNSVPNCFEYIKLSQ